MAEINNNKLTLIHDHTVLRRRLLLRLFFSRLRDRGGYMGTKNLLCIKSVSIIAYLTLPPPSRAGGNANCSTTLTAKKER
ncbi:hypothetical protein D3C75_698140 [compost metagenome]